MIIHIFSCSTGIYNKLFDDERIKSLNNLFPNIQKTFTLLTDEKDTLNKESFLNVLSDEYITINFYHICNLVYPFITLFKYNYIEDAIDLYKYNEDDYFLYLDATSLCLNKHKLIWNSIIDDILNYEICYAINPYNNNLDINVEDEIDYRSKHHVDIDTYNKDKDKWCQASFLMGSIKGLQKINNIINQLLLDDIRYTNNNRQKQCILPNFMEQHYLNYIFYNLDKYNISCINKHYIDYNINTQYNDVFILCHYKYYDIIKDKRDSKVYNKFK